MKRDNKNNILFSDQFNALTDHYITMVTNLVLDAIVRDNTFFVLLPDIKKPPVIVSDLINNFNQSTYASQSIAIIDNEISMLENTDFTLSIYAIDPSQRKNPYNINNLVFTWKRDGNVIKEAKGNDGILLSITGSDCKEKITGVYSCEVSNKYGSDISDNISIFVYQLKHVPFFYKNLVKNGYGNEGVNEWNNDDGTFIVENFAALSYKWDKGLDSVIANPNFLFSDGIVTNVSESIERKTKINTIPNNNFDFYQNQNLTAYPYPWTNFYPTPDVFFPSLVKETAINEIAVGASKMYFTRNELSYEMNGGGRICEAYQDIDISDLNKFVNGEVYGVTHLSAWFFCYIGGAVSYYDSIHVLGKVEDYTTITLEFYDSNSEQLVGPYGISKYNRPDILKGPDECELIFSTDDFTRYITPQKIVGRKSYLPLIPFNTSFIRVRISFDHKGTQQNLQEPEIYNWSENIVQRNEAALGLTTIAQNEQYQQFLHRINRYGKPRNLVTGMNLLLFPNDSKQQFTIPTVLSPTNNILSIN